MMFNASTHPDFDERNWSHKTGRFPSTWGYATSVNPMRLNNTMCKGKHKCVMCQKGQPHLPHAFTSPIASQLNVQDLIFDTRRYAQRRIGKFGEEVLINNNVFEIVYGMIKANDAVFGKIQNAPAVILEACDAVADIVGSEKWHSKILKHKDLLQKAVGFKG